MRLKKSVPENELFTISVPVKELNRIDWEREGKEFKYNGTMYDIVSSKSEKDVIHFYCVNDQQETELFVHLEEAVSQQMNNEKSPLGRTAKNLVKLFKYISSENFVFSREITAQQNNAFMYSVFYSPVFIEIPTPPPNLVV